MENKYLHVNHWRTMIVHKKKHGEMLRLIKYNGNVHVKIVLIDQKFWKHIQLGDQDSWSTKEQWLTMLVWTCMKN